MIFILAHSTARSRAIDAIKDSPDGYEVRIKEPTRTSAMNAKFHAICGDIAKAGIEWAGKKRSAAQWKVLLVSGHAVATKEQGEIVPGLEGEFVAIRESTALMSKRRAASLIEYAIAFAASNNIKLHDGHDGFEYEANIQHSR